VESSVKRQNDVWVREPRVSLYVGIVRFAIDMSEARPVIIPLNIIRKSVAKCLKVEVSSMGFEPT
jgi:hypothetical protein